MSDPTSVEARLARIERVIAGLSAEVAAIRAELRLPESNGTTPPPSARHPMLPPDAVTRRSGLALGSRTVTAQDLERLVGSYGMLAIAVLAAVAAVGTFLSWAISHGFIAIGPSARVLIGLAFAAAIGVWGTRLRSRERSFGSSLLGLSLVIVHVCAYAAGPSFALVPTWVAFAGAAAASWALTVFAHREVDEPLWCVGFGGAAVAPFVTSNGHGSLYALLGYGTLVVAIAGVSPLAVPSRKRGAIRWLSLLAALADAYRQAGVGHHARAEAVALMGAMLVCLALVDRESDVEQSSMLPNGREHPVFLDWIDALAIPLIFAGEAAFSIGPVAPKWSVLAIASIVLAAFCSRRRLGGLRDASAFGAVTMAVGAVAAASVEAPAGLCASLVAIALAAFAMHVVRPSKSWLRSGATTFLGAAIVSVGALRETPAVYHTAPFLREASASALIVLVGLIIVARSWRAIRAATRAAVGDRGARLRVPFERRTLRAATMSPWVWAFVWVLIELAFAYSATASTLLLVTYFAATAVACVAVGRSRSSSRLRQAGLALAVVSAATAVYGAHAYFDFGARILAYLVISAFLLGIAYWYRRPGPAPSPA